MVTLVTGTAVASWCVGAGAVVRTGEIPQRAFVNVLAVGPVSVVTVPAVAAVGALGVEAVGPLGALGKPCHQRAARTLICVPANRPVAMVAVLTLTVVGAIGGVAHGVRVARAAGIEANLLAHAHAFVIRQAEDAGTGVGARAVVARLVRGTGTRRLALIDILTDKAISLVAILALAQVGPVCVLTLGELTAVVGQGGVKGTLVHIRAGKACALSAHRARAVEGSWCI